MGWLRKAPPPRLSVLMVCMGNICRSPTAEGVLRARLQAAGLDKLVAVDSAGTHGYHAGDAPDVRAQRHALQRGVHIASLRARPVTEVDFERFDLILAMDEANLRELERLCPNPRRVTPQLLMSFARRHADQRHVPDPYYGGPDGFERVLDLVEDACDGLLQHLRDRLTAPGDGTS